jgi:hypothetical protein
MNKLANGTIYNGDHQYIPMEAFRAMFEQENDFPYANKFSLEPLITEWEERANQGKAGFAAGTLQILKDLSEEIQIQQEVSSDWYTQNQFGEMIASFFPAFFFKGQMGFIGVPFKKQFVYRSPAMIEMMTRENLEIKTPELTSKVMNVNKKILEAGYLILRKLYNQDIELPFNELLHVRNSKTQLERHYKFNIILDYVEVRPLKRLKKLSNTQIQDLLDNMGDIDKWKKAFPLENFAFEGFVVGFLSDVTQMEILSQMKARIVRENTIGDAINDGQRIAEVQAFIRSYLEMADVEYGFMQSIMGGWQERTTYSICRFLSNNYELKTVEKSKATYVPVFSTETPQIVNDLSALSHLSKIEKAFVKAGYRSFLLAPLFDSRGNFMGIFELTSKQAYRFNNLTLLHLKDVIEFFNSVLERGFTEVNNYIDLIIKQQFTSIHPSVEWKFAEVASNFFFNQRINEENNKLAPIVFKNVYPLYGQSDIVSSSKLRNKSIEADLIDNLEQLLDVIESCLEVIPFHLLEVYQFKLQDILDRLNRGEFVSSDESQIVELLTKEVHPLLRQLQERYTELPANKLQLYFDYIDPDLDIVYKQRKDYEDSVSMLNGVIGGYLDHEDNKMQKILPHFFEKYSTDGVEYNIYLGQEILKEGNFSEFFLKDFRLWQLINMCEITRLVKRKSQEFPVPLATAQLIFVYNNALSIRFRMDEKQFDVDGAYNVRYEILKKRIDKALIKGTQERLTQKDKIAIVWLQEKDRLEYLQYLNHLAVKGYIEEEIEEYELEKLQGAEGLKALRVTVKYD